MGAIRECVCGCGREVPRKHVSYNLRAMQLMGELVEFDRMRYGMKGAGSSEQENLDGFIADGAVCYQSILAVLHGGERVYLMRETNRWLKFARKTGKRLAKETGLVRPDKPPLALREEDLPYVNGVEPELSFTGNDALQDEAAQIKREAEAKRAQGDRARLLTVEEAPSEIEEDDEDGEDDEFPDMESEESLEYYRALGRLATADPERAKGIAQENEGVPRAARR